MSCPAAFVLRDRLRPVSAPWMAHRRSEPTSPGSETRDDFDDRARGGRGSGQLDTWGLSVRSRSRARRGVACVLPAGADQAASQRASPMLAWREPNGCQMGLASSCDGATAYRRPATLVSSAWRRSDASRVSSASVRSARFAPSIPQPARPASASPQENSTRQSARSRRPRTSCVQDSGSSGWNSPYQRRVATLRSARTANASTELGPAPAASVTWNGSRRTRSPGLARSTTPWSPSPTVTVAGRPRAANPSLMLIALLSTRSKASTSLPFGSSASAKATEPGWMPGSSAVPARRRSGRRPRGSPTRRRDLAPGRRAHSRAVRRGSPRSARAVRSRSPPRARCASLHSRSWMRTR